MHGSCLCSEVAWQAEGPVELVVHCHCSMCRKFHGSAFVTFGSVPAGTFRWLGGRELIRRFDSSPGLHRTSCRRCGSWVPRDPGGRPHFLALGGLEGVTEARPLAHCFVASKAAWHEVTDSVHCFDDAPPGYEVPVVPERTRPHAEGGRAAGSCLCGRVTYEIESEGATFRHCHCSRCRRARGAVHASNMLLQIPRFRWTGGAEMVEDYRLPEAERFAQAFCRACGSAVPRVNQELGYVVVPAGGLDDDPGIRPKEHIFVGSKAPWYEISDMLPQHREYAPQ